MDSGLVLNEGVSVVGTPARGVLRCVGPRATEKRIFREVELYQEQVQASPELLQKPMLIIVSSDFLRKRLLFQLSRGGRPALLGVRVATMTSVASELCRELPSCGQGARLLSLLIQRELQRDPTLAAALGDLDSGASTIVGAVGDLLDAGFEPALDEVLLESLQSENPFHILPEHSVAHPELGQRVSALVGLTSRVARTLQEQNLELPGQLLQRASELISHSNNLEHHRILIHGFAEATGAATRFLESLVAHRNALLLLSSPEDPARPGTLDLGLRFTERLCVRLKPYGYAEEIEFATERPKIVCRVARGILAEVHEASLKIIELLEEGVDAESIALCARDLEPYKSAVVDRLYGLGVPFSVAKTEGGILPDWHSVQRLFQFLDLGSGLTVEPWLDLCAKALWSEFEEPELIKDLLRARVLEYGISKISDLHTLKDPMLPENENIGCGAVVGLKDSSKEQVTGRRRLAHEHVPSDALIRLGHHTEKALERLEGHRASHSIREHFSWLRQFCFSVFGESQDSPFMSRLEVLFQKAQAWVPSDFDLNFSECLELLEKAFDSSARESLGGAGGGVSLVNAMEARACTFEHLFVLGLNRGVFPRASVEDPMLPDSHRLRLRNSDVLPDIPIKRGANAEERYLFSELMSASPNLYLSWLLVDEDGRECAASPFLERLRNALGLGADQDMELARAPRALRGEQIRTPLDVSVVHGLHGARKDLLPLWSLTHKNALNAESSAALLSTLNEQDPDLATREGQEAWADTSPYLGAIGPVMSDDDPRSDVPFVTTIEGIAGCPWRTFLSVYLGLAPAADPYMNLPGLENYQLGNLVHEALHVMAQWTLEVQGAPVGRGSRRVSDVLGRQGVPMVWPDRKKMLALLNKLARRLLLENNRGFVGLAPAIAVHALDYLEVVQAYWKERDGLRLLGSELRGEIRGEHSERGALVCFKVDCVHEGEGGAQFIDYKTGKAPERGAFLSRVRRGTYLQSAVYAASDEQASGAYVFCNPDQTPGRSMDQSTDEMSDTYDVALDQTLRAVLAAIEDGVFFPRTVKPDKDAEPDACGRCDVKEACVRGDSGARTRLQKWADKGYEDELTRDTTFQRLWRLANGKFDFLQTPEAGEES